MNYFIINASIILSSFCYLLLYLLIRQTKLIHRLQFNATTSTPCHVTYVNTAITNDNHRSRNFHYSGRTTLQSTVPASILFNKQRIPSTVRARHSIEMKSRNVSPAIFHGLFQSTAFYLRSRPVERVFRG